MKNFTTIFIVFIGLVMHKTVFNQTTTCGDWKPFKDEKCFKVFDDVGLKNFADAKQICEDKNGSLINVHFQEEEDFLIEYLKSIKIADNLWIGAKYGNNKYIWIDDTEIVYKNWATDSPKNLADHCVQFQADETSFGKWSDVLCTKKNLVVCQKQHTWSIDHIQNLLMNVMKNPVPIGFIYVQLPKETSPQVIWSWMTWKDVSEDYAGVFFRVSGGESASFGQIQNDNAPRLSKVKSITLDATNENNVKEIDIPKSGSSAYITSGDWNAGKDRLLSFELSEGEIRPRNMAIKVWKRIG